MDKLGFSSKREESNVLEVLFGDNKLLTDDESIQPVALKVPSHHQNYHQWSSLQSWRLLHAGTLREEGVQLEEKHRFLLHRFWVYRTCSSSLVLPTAAEDSQQGVSLNFEQTPQGLWLDVVRSVSVCPDFTSWLLCHQPNRGWERFWSLEKRMGCLLCQNQGDFVDKLENLAHSDLHKLFPRASPLSGVVC